MIKKILRRLKKLSKKMLMFIKPKHKANIIELDGGKITVHETVTLNSNPYRYHVGMPFETTVIADMPGARIEIGEKTRIHGSYIHAWKKITIGKNVLIAAGTTIIDANGHSSSIKNAKRRGETRDTPSEVVIEDYVWIGMNSIILKGVTIGEGAVVSAGSVVNIDVPPYSVAQGNPVKIIKQYSPKEIEA
jgi:acetyltransferase-like isoleucine patch superfamily enzyme